MISFDNEFSFGKASFTSDNTPLDWNSSSIKIDNIKGILVLQDHCRFRRSF
jgi:hypothetical protein